jgi:ribose 5-phosphate isomerase
MMWEDVKTAVRKSGLKHTVLNKNGEYEMVHVEQPNGNFIRDTHLYKYEPQDWERKLKIVGVQIPNEQLNLFA